MTKIVTTNAPLFTASRCDGVVFKIDPVAGGNRENQATHRVFAPLVPVLFRYGSSSMRRGTAVHFRTTTRLYARVAFA